MTFFLIILAHSFKSPYLLFGPSINKILGKNKIAETKLAKIVVINRIPNWFKIATLQKTKKMPAKIEVRAPPNIV